MLELTQTQRAIYFEGQFFGEVVNNIGGYQKYFCDLDVARFARARDLVLKANDAYRLRFLKQDAGCAALLTDAAPPALPALDFSQESDPEAHARAWMQQQFETGFGDLAQQVFQDALLKISAKEYWYLAKAHHLVMDGWAFALQMQRFVELYDRLGQGAADAIQYPSFVPYLQRQREYGESKAYRDDKAYWLARHATAVGSLLPLREDGEHVGPVASRRVSRAIGRPLFDALQGLAQRCDANIVAVFHAVLYLYFARAYAANEVVIGMPVHNRRDASQKQIIGSLVNVNACPVHASPDEPFTDLVRRLAQQLRRDFRHSRFPIGDLVRMLRERADGPAGDTHHISFNYQKLDFGLVMDGKPVETHYLTHNHERIPATFVLCEYGAAQDIAFHLDYNTGYFDETAAQAVLERMHSLLEQALDCPARPIDQFALLTGAERQRQLVEWNDTAAPFDSDACIDHLIERQAHEVPDRLAITSAVGSLTYLELNQQANRVAHQLIEMGVSQEQMVGVYMRRSPLMIVAMLAILKAGACYVPIDTAYPSARIGYILEDSAVSLVLTDMSVEALPGAARRLNVDQLLAAPPALPQLLDAPVGAGRHPGQLAYVIYTSGSTGQPKGVLIEHRNAAALIGWAARTYSSAELQGVLASTSICFDLSIFEIFVPLSTGGGVILVDNALALRDGVAGNVTLINTVPSAIRALLETGSIPASTRCINLAGELLHQELVESIHKAVAVRVFDLYGPSEDTTYSTFAPRRPGGHGTIGRPIDNTRAYVLDDQGNLLPAGQTGELYLGGAGLARGYLNRPALTAERFVFNAHANERVYRTGDLVRFMSDGQLQYIGRKDHQVKIRGYRIELGEIEACISRHPNVKACAVVVRQDQAGGPSLAASLVAQGAAGAQEGLVDAVRDMLVQALPAYMVPASIDSLDALPLTNNGKLDRAALCARHIPVRAITSLRMPCTETQKSIAGLWQQVLGLASPGLDDDFFKLGGDSLSLLKLAAQLETTFGVRIALPSLFVQATIDAQARWIDQQLVVARLLVQITLTDDAQQQSYIEL
jgi:amino acid adenylation domain-containing protein